MDAETLAHAFDQFYRASDARRLAPDGSGVGLYAARGLLRAMGGEITAESRPGAWHHYARQPARRGDRRGSGEEAARTTATGRRENAGVTREGTRVVPRSPHLQGGQKGASRTLKPLTQQESDPVMKLPLSSPARAQPRGQALVEFALILPLLVLLLLLAIDFGRVFFGWVALNNAARIAANEAAVQPAGLGGQRRCGAPGHLSSSRQVISDCRPSTARRPAAGLGCH